MEKVENGGKKKVKLREDFYCLIQKNTLFYFFSDLNRLNLIKPSIMGAAPESHEHTKH